MKRSRLRLRLEAIRTAFPGRHAGASLKPRDGRVPVLGIDRAFPGRHAGASLKRPHALGAGRDGASFPRQTRRGLIEALARAGAHSYIPNPFPRQTRRGLIEASM